MLTTALLELEGLPSRMIQELAFCEREQRVRGRFAGQVLKSTHDDKFTSLLGTCKAIKYLMGQRLQKLHSCIEGYNVNSSSLKREKVYK